MLGSRIYAVPLLLLHAQNWYHCRQAAVEDAAAGIGRLPLHRGRRRLVFIIAHLGASLSLAGASCLCAALSTAKKKPV